MHGLVTVIPVVSVESGTPSAWVRIESRYDNESSISNMT